MGLLHYGSHRWLRFHWSLQEQIALARELLPFKRPTLFNLTVSHKTRLWLNRTYNVREAVGKNKVFEEKSEKASPNEPQD